MACCGDTPTLETLAAVTILREAFPELKIRVVNVVDLMRLQSDRLHPHGLSDRDYDMLFTTDRPIVFAFHGYPSLIHELTYLRTNKNLHVRGYMEEGTITTAFDMRVLNKIDRFNLVLTALQNLPGLGNRSAFLAQQMKDKLVEHRQYISRYGVDMPEVANWRWTAAE
jgi:xylulose-5-phosphate/fructose-6-phosphate phosphoketolase